MGLLGANNVGLMIVLHELIKQALAMDLLGLNAQLDPFPVLRLVPRERARDGEAM